MSLLSALELEFPCDPCVFCGSCDRTVPDHAAEGFSDIRTSTPLEVIRVPIGLDNRGLIMYVTRSKMRKSYYPG